MKCLVTGANGFLGSWLCKRLLREGLEVQILRRRTSDISEITNLNIEHKIGDVTDLASLKDATQGVDVVFHLAGLIAYKASQREAMEKINVQGTANLVEACLVNNIKKLIHVSSVTAIGAGFHTQQILNEESEYNIHHLNLGYFETKRQAEIIVKKACAEKKLNAVIVNPSTIYGAGDALKGSRKTQVQVAKGKMPFYTSGGVNIISIENAVEGIWQAFKKGRTGERYILAGENITIKKLFQIIAEEAGVTPPKICLPKFFLIGLGWLGDFFEKFGISLGFSLENAYTSTLFHWFDASKAERELNLPKTDARKAIQSSIQWAKQHGLV